MIWFCNMVSGLIIDRLPGESGDLVALGYLMFEKI